MLLLKNKTAHLDFELLKKYTAGLVLTGPEVKSVRAKHGSLQGSFVKILGGEAFLLNAQVNPYAAADNKDYDPKRTRKLLLSKKEIAQLSEAADRPKTTIVPLAVLAVGRYIKLELAVARGKKQFEKRADLKKKTIKRELDKQFKQSQIKM
jgi:SsrA-binding protein